MVRKVQEVVTYGVFIDSSLALSMNHFVSSSSQWQIAEWLPIESCHNPPKLGVASKVLSNILLLGAWRLERVMIELIKCIVTSIVVIVEFS